MVIRMRGVRPLVTLRGALPLITSTTTQRTPPKPGLIVSGAFKNPRNRKVYITKSFVVDSVYL